MEEYLKSTFVINCDATPVKEKAQSVTKGQKDEIAKAKALFYFVRDQIKYNPYLPMRTEYFTLENHKASATLERGEGYCVPKAILLTALARAVDIPARLGFADIRNHHLPEEIAKIATNNVLPYHGYCELYLAGRWIKATPAFDLKTFQDHQLIPVEFDGRNDAVFHRYNREGKLHIEYIRDHGYREDLPWDEFSKGFWEF